MHGTDQINYNKMSADELETSDYMRDPNLAEIPGAIIFVVGLLGWVAIILLIVAGYLLYTWWVTL